METDNLRTASVYINNLLLSRGLLKNGQNLDFAHPEQGEGGSEGTMGRIMGVVNDLILRRDRDATQRENLSNTIRTLRADALRQTTDLTRLQTKHAEAQRKLGLSEATERALKAQLRGAEGAARGLREEMGRMRVLVGQARAQCANEVRKRERVIEGLKKHVGEGGRARGSGKAVGVATVTVVAGVGGEEEGGVVAVGESDYDLRQETNEFLTELAKGLSEESENLGMLLRTTVESLKALSGWEREEQGAQGGELVISVDDSYENVASEIDSVIEHLRTLLTNPSFVPLEEVEVREDEIIRLREGWERMESRWRDAVRMMDGWRKRMATSGQTVNLEELKAGLELSPVKDLSAAGKNHTQDLEDGYEEGDTQADIDAMDDSQVPGGEDLTPDLDEMSDASSFDEEPVDDFVVEPVPQIMAPPVQAAKPVEDEVVEQRQKRSGREGRIELNSSLNTQEDNKKKRKLEPQPPSSASSRVSKPRTDSGSDIGSSRRAPVPCKEQVVERQQPEPEPEMVPAPSSSPGPPPQLSPLRPIPDPNHRRKSDFTTIVEENTWDFAQLERSDPAPASDEISLLKSSNAHHDAPPPTTEQSARLAATPLKLTGASRLPRPASALAQESPLTMASIAAKLAATEREADAARVRAKLKAAKLSSAAAATNLAPPPRRSEAEVEREPVKGGEVEEPVPRKRKASGRMGGRTSRRRSTLSPWELESLILGGVAESPAK